MLRPRAALQNGSFRVWPRVVPHTGRRFCSDHTPALQLWSSTPWVRCFGYHVVPPVRVPRNARSRSGLTFPGRAGGGSRPKESRQARRRLDKHTQASGSCGLGFDLFGGSGVRDPRKDLLGPSKSLRGSRTPDPPQFEGHTFVFGPGPPTPRRGRNIGRCRCTPGRCRPGPGHGEPGRRGPELFGFCAQNSRHSQY